VSDRLLASVAQVASDVSSAVLPLFAVNPSATPAGEQASVGEVVVSCPLFPVPCSLS
jgi:hypothetical protein